MRTIILLLLCLLFVSQAAALDMTALRAAESKIGTFFENSTTTKVITGSDLSAPERQLYKRIFSMNNRTRNVTMIPDVEAWLLPQTDYVLLGKENVFLEKALNGTPISEELMEAEPFSFTFHTLEERKVLVVETMYRTKNYGRTTRSPLGGLIPDTFIPPAATFIALLLLWLGKAGGILVSLFKKVVSLKTSGWWKSRFKDKQAKHHIRIGTHISIREIVSVLAAIFIVAGASLLNREGPLLEVFLMLLLTSGLINLYREGLRILYCRWKHLHVEKIFWPIGAVMTVVSAWLGNMFALTAYWRTFEDKHGRGASMSHFLAVMTLLLGIVAAAWNLLSPSPLAQMLGILGITIPTLDLLPIPPLSGHSIRKWHPWWWLGTFIVALAFYVTIVFILP